MARQRRVVVCATTYRYYEFFVDSSEISEDSDESASAFVMDGLNEGTRAWPDEYNTDSGGIEVTSVEAVEPEALGVTIVTHENSTDWGGEG